MTVKRHIIVVLLENESGALSRVANLFSARGFNIETLNVATTLDPTLSRLTLTSVGSPNVLDQIIKQLNKLIDVVDARVCNPEDSYSLEYALLTVVRCPQTTEYIRQLEQQTSRCRISPLEENDKTIIFGLSADSENLESIFAEFDRQHIVEISRSGALSVARHPLDSPQPDNVLDNAG